MSLLRKDLGGEGRRQGVSGGKKVPGRWGWGGGVESVQRPCGGCDVSEDQQEGLCGRNQVSEAERSGNEVGEVTGPKPRRPRWLWLMVSETGAGVLTGALWRRGGELPARRRQALGGGGGCGVQVGGALGGGRGG